MLQQSKVLKWRLFTNAFWSFREPPINVTLQNWVSDHMETFIALIGYFAVKRKLSSDKMAISHLSRVATLNLYKNHFTTVIKAFIVRLPVLLQKGS